MTEKRLLVRKVHSCAPDGSAIIRRETLEVNIVWPGESEPPSRGNYWDSTEWSILPKPMNQEPKEKNGGEAYKAREIWIANSRVPKGNKICYSVAVIRTSLNRVKRQLGEAGYIRFVESPPKTRKKARRK